MALSDFENKKNKLLALVKAAGYNNLRSLSVKCGIAEANLYSNLQGRYNMSMKRMFAIAKVVRRPIDEVIEIFYSDEMSENRRIFDVECERLSNMSMHELREYITAIRGGMQKM